MEHLGAASILMRQNLTARAREDEAPKPLAEPLPGDENHESLIAAATASERPAVEFAARTAMALGSVASWIEQPQKRFAKTAPVASEAQTQRIQVMHDALGSLDQTFVLSELKVETASTSSVYELIRRIEARLSVAPAEGRVPLVGGEIQAGLCGVADRIAHLSELLPITPRRIGRRVVKAEDELRLAVAEIRGRQAALNESPTASAAPSLSGPDRGQAYSLLSLRTDIAKLSNQLEIGRAPSQAVFGHLNQQMQLLRGSVGSLPTGRDLAGIGRSVAELSAQLGRASDMGRDIAHIGAQIETLHGAVCGLAETSPAPEDARLSRDIESSLLKLERFSAAGGDSAQHGAMLEQFRENWDSVANLAALADVTALSLTLSELRDEVAGLNARQLDTGDAAELKTSIADLQRVLAARPPSPEGEGTRAHLASGLRPVEALLQALLNKLDSIEQRVAYERAGPVSLAAHERQIADLAISFAQSSGRVPEVADLESAISGLMEKIATLRKDSFEAAERAARKAVAETLSAAPACSVAIGHGVPEESLAAVDGALESVATPISGLNLVAIPAGGSLRVAAAAQDPANPAPPLPERPHTREVRQEARLNAILEEAACPVTPPTRDELLLELDSSSSPDGKSIAEARCDGAEIRSSLIAAARRAAMAAAADSVSIKSRAGQRRAEASGQRLYGRSKASRLRALIDKHRRPMVLSAASLVVVLGAFQTVGRTPVPRTAFARVEQPVAPAPAQVALVDPITTQSITPKLGGQLEPAPTVGSHLPVPPHLQAPASAAAQPAPPAPVASTASLSPITPLVPPAETKPAPAPEAATLPTGLRMAALAGNPVAAYEYASRAAEGRGVPKDTLLAQKLFETAAAKGLAPAQYRLGNLYEKGIGVVRNTKAAKSWFRKAADGGNARAMHNLAVLLAEGTGTKPDYQAAVGWFTRAADHGMPDSQFNLAVLYSRGLGTALDLKKAYVWFAVAAANRDADAAKKRDEVGSRLAPADLARAKADAEHWRVTPPTPAGNEVVVPASGWPDAAASTAGDLATKPAPDGRV